MRKTRLVRSGVSFTEPYHHDFGLPVSQVTARFLDAGHILGLAQVVLDIACGSTRTRVLISGDLGRCGLPVIRAGVFTVGGGLMGAGQALTAGSGLFNTFATGVLAAVVASPCTAPFMGTALGFAITRPAGEALAVFLALGVGFALPVVLLSLGRPRSGGCPNRDSG